MAVETRVDTKGTELPWTPKGMLIGSDWVPAKSGETFTDVNPSTGGPLVEVPSGDKADVDAAVATARRTFEEGSWRKMSPDERGRLLWRIADLVEKHADEIALLDTLENGKPLTMAKIVDLPMSAQMFRYWAGWPTKLEGATIPVSMPFGEYHAYTQREPAGVVGLIIPWNFPSVFIGWKVGAALACGNTVVLKPAEETSLSALRISELMLEAGLPEGVLNVVTGYGETAGAALASHPDVDKVAFTGSVETGKLIVQAAVGNLKRVSLELGGKSPNIVFADADLETTIPGVAGAIFFNAGCVCTAGSRLFVHKSLFDDVVGGLSGAASSIKLGPGIDPETQMGPVVSEAQLQKVTGLVESGLADGAKPATGGKPADREGFFYEPTVLVDVKPEMRVVQEEIFGPVVVAQPFDDVDELIKQANTSEYGLAAGMWTSDVQKAHRVAAEIRAGTVWVNCYNMIDPALPFGGFKQSGWGRDLGREALDLYTQTKAVCIKYA